MSPNLRGLKPYLPPPRSARYVSLDANESPFDLPAVVRRKFIGRIRKLIFNRYPDGSSAELRQAVARRLRVSPDWIVAGNGSDELIGCLIDAFVAPGETMVIPDPTFVMYERMARIRGARVVKIPLDESFDLSSRFLDARLLRDAKLWFFAYPNNPTANCFSERLLLEILKKARGIVVVDEAYVDFSRKTFLPRLQRFPNLVILRTFSKALGIALGRVGLAIARPAVIDALNIVRLPYNLSGLGQALALTTMEAETMIRRNIEMVIRERDRLAIRLSKSRILDPCRADANFVLARVRRGSSAKNVFEFLRARGILVKIFHEPRLVPYVRITVGRPRDMRRLESALEKLEMTACRK